MNTKKSKIKRVPRRAVYDIEKIYALLDKEILCHVAFVYENYPVVIPMLYGRNDDYLYIHGASVSRMITQLEKGINVCVSIANVNALVLARSAFHHSVNYESVVIYGRGEWVAESEKEKALQVISDHVIPGRWGEVRPPNEKEMKATKVIKIHIDKASAKIRTGPPEDEKLDRNLPIWAGLVPLIKQYGMPINDDLTDEITPVSNSVANLLQQNKSEQQG